MSRIMTTVITSLLFTGMSLAQNTSASDQETIRLLVQQVKELQEKVKTLEAKQSDSEATPPQPTTFQQDVAEQAAEPNQSPIAPLVLHESHGIQWRGFGEVNYKAWTSESRSCQLLDLCLVRPAISIPASSPFFLPPESMTRPACSPKSCLMNMLNIDGSQVESDEDNGNHVNVGLFARPDAIPGLQFGGSFYHDKITNHDFTPAPRLGQSIVNAHIVYVGHGIEFLNEGFLIRHLQEHSQTVFNMPAFYSQFSKRFQKVSPFFRYQYANTNPRSIFEDVLLRHGPSFGARYDFNDNIAFKTQLDHTIRKDKPDLNGLQLQLAFAF